MKRNNVIIILGALLLLVIFVVLFAQNNSNFDWRESYQEESQEPYGTYVIYELLKNYFPNQDFTHLQDSLYFDSTIVNGNYIFIGQGLLLDSISNTRLLQFVEKGNHAFLSSQTVPNRLIKNFFSDTCYNYWTDYDYFFDTIASYQFYELDTSSFTYKYMYRNEALPYSWGILPTDYYSCYDSANIQLLGGSSDSIYINFIQIPYGKGNFYFHTVPLVFSNYHIIKEEQLVYVERLFSHLHEGPIYWDEKSRTVEWIARRQNDDPYSYNNQPSKGSPLRYILSQAPLAWAWYLLLSLGILYLIFRGKRRQRIIPVLEQNRNTSLEFLATIGRLYFLRNNHKELAIQKMKFFLAFIRERYNLQTKNLDNSFVNRLANKSEINPQKIEKILLISQNIENSNFVSETTLIDFHYQIDHFYKNCK